MQLKRRASPLPPLVPFVLPLLGRSGLVKRRWLALWKFFNLDGPVGVGTAFRIVWTRFRLMRRYLAYRPLQVPRIFWMLGLIAHGVPGHGPVHLLQISAAEVGFAWGGEQQGCCTPRLQDVDGTDSALSERYN